MKSPAFWNKRDTLLVKALRPLSKFYGDIVQARLKNATPYVSKLPVICIGNVVMGGSGKTPVVQAIVRLLKESGKNPAILLRGYGGSNKETVSVDIHQHNAMLVGDEALLHATETVTMVSADRVKGAQAIEKDTWTTHIVMDDGLQNPSLKKTLSFLVVDGANPFGNEEIFPAGPLRESIEAAVKRVQAIVVMGQKNSDITTRFGFLLPIFQAKLAPVDPQQFSGKKVLAFAGIGNPQKFFATLRSNGADIVEEKSFPDHYVFSAREINSLLQQAVKQDAILVTTRKDWMRLAPIHREKIYVLDVVLEWEDPAAIIDFLRLKEIL